MLEIDVLVVRNFLIALAIGALVGIEREKHKSTEHPNSFGGVRTYILLAQMGAVSSWLSLHLQSPWLFMLALAAATIAVMSAYVLENRQTNSLGLTSQISAVTVCLLGGAVMYGYAEIAVVMAIVTSAVLTFKQPLHGFVDKLGADDLVAAVKLAIATFIVLPLLPNHTIDPWQILNPYKLWLLVILISGLSLLGYIAVRALGQARGHAIAGLAGGLVSSTAVSLSFARLSRLVADRGETATTPAPSLAAQQQETSALAAGILLAWLMMCLRLLVMVGLLALPLFEQLWPMLTAMAVVSGVAALWFYQKGSVTVGGAVDAVKVTNPFSLLAAAQFGLLFLLVLSIVRLTELYLPMEGLYLVAAIAGTTDVDAITLSMAELAKDENKLAIAAAAIVIATLSNTLVKALMVAVLGSALLRRQIALAATGIFIAGSLSLLLGG